MITQKKNGNKISFDFQEEYFLYTIKDSNQTQSLKVPYISVQTDTIDEFVEKNDWFRNVGFLWIILWWYHYFVYWYTWEWLLLWIIMLVVYTVRTTNFSILNSSEWRVLIIQDEQNCEIIGKIQSEKRKILREKLFLLDKNNSPENELEKYTYLKYEKAITEEEFTKISEELLMLHGVVKT